MKKDKVLQKHPYQITPPVMVGIIISAMGRET